MIKIVKMILDGIAFLVSLPLGAKGIASWSYFRDRVATFAYRRRFKAVGGRLSLPSNAMILGAQHMTVGSGFTALRGFRIEAFSRYKNRSYSPSIVIGDDVSMNCNVHIGAIREIVIGSHVLIGSNVLITDHAHGCPGRDLALPFVERPLYSKGPVIIADNVWIGENVAILAGVRIGEGAIIGANAVVTRDVPAGCIAMGVPARVVRPVGRDGGDAGQS